MIVSNILDQIECCIDDMQSEDVNKAQKADARFQLLAQGLFNIIKAY